MHTDSAPADESAGRVAAEGSAAVVFFLGGVAALLYETLWARALTRVLGGHGAATATVLAVFMAGLGGGAWLFAKLARRARHPQRGYAALEAFAAVWAALSPLLFDALEPVGTGVARACIAALFLLPPTLAMGATFPWMGRLVIADRAGAGSDTSRFYALNTLGAAAGALLGPALVMPLFGLRAGSWVAAGVGATAAALALRLPATRARDAAQGSVAFDPSWLVPASFGAAALALEVLLTRVLITVTGASTYAFAIVLATFLIGIALGSWHVRAQLARGSSPAQILLRCAAAAPIAVFAGVVLLRWTLGRADLFESLSNRALTSASPLALWSSHALSAALVLLAPAFAFGAALPAAVALALQRAPNAAHELVLGRVYAANTLGALLGALAAGFVLMPALGMRWSIVAALAPCALAAVALRPALRVRTLATVAATLALGLWALRPRSQSDGRQVVYLRAGLFETVAVEDTREPDGTTTRSIRLNGKVEASTAPVDVRLQRLLAALPALRHGEVRSALVIGAGSGMTAGTLLDLTSLERLTLYEIEPAVLPATRHFDAWNNALLTDARLAVQIADGRNALMRSGERFDLITADPIHPWTRGSSDLYTLEYFRAVAAHLAPGGVASQWVPLYELSTADVQTIAATWCASFARVEAYLTAYDLALLGWNAPTGRELAAVELDGALATHLAEIGVHSALDLAALCVAHDADLRAWSAAVAPMRDDRPVLEFRAPLAYAAGYSIDVLRWCARSDFVERLPSAARGRATRARELLVEFLDALPESPSAAAASYGRKLMTLGER